MPAKSLAFYFQGEGHSKGSYDQNMTVPTIFAEMLLLLGQNVVWRNGFGMFKVKVTVNFKMLLNVCPDDIFRIVEPFSTKLCLMMHHYEPDCFPKR